MSIIQEMPQKIHTNPIKGLAWLDLLLLLLLTAFILSGINLVPFHGDESTYILMSQDYDRVIKGDFKHVLFNPDGGSKQDIRMSTGSILPFLIGFAKDITNTKDRANNWRWGVSWEENVEQGNIPNSKLLYLARICSALMGALGILLFFITTRKLFSSRLAAWAATLVLATNGYILVNFRRAMQEGPKFLSLILTLYIATCILKSSHTMKIHKHFYMLLGIASGLTLATKQDTAPMLVGIYIALILIPIWEKRAVQAILTNTHYLGIATILAYSCFLAFMPVFWSWWETVLVLIGIAAILFQLPAWKTNRSAKPLVLAGCLLIIGMTFLSPILWSKFQIPVTSMVETRQKFLKEQVGAFGNNNFNTAKDKIIFLGETVLSSKVMYMESSSFDVPPIHDQINAYEASPLSGRTGSILTDCFILVLVIIGAWSQLRQFGPESILICSLLIVSGALLYITVPLPWQRYFLIMQIPYALIAGAGAKPIWLWGKETVINKKVNIT
jgi:4-amino-4-deoxy-L-arabinose transferase-like glycosyltransferase